MSLPAFSGPVCLLIEITKIFSDIRVDYLEGLKAAALVPGHWNQVASSPAARGSLLSHTNWRMLALVLVPFLSPTTALVLSCEGFLARFPHRSSVIRRRSGSYICREGFTMKPIHRDGFLLLQNAFIPANADELAPH